MRLGLDPCRLLKGSRAEQAYGDGLVFERHRHRYEVNNRFRRRLEDAGLVFSGTSPDGRLVEMIELPDHPWFVAGQFHPEFRSRPTRPHPLFRDFVGAATAFADGRDRSAATPTPAPGVRSDGAPAHRNGGDPVPAPIPASTSSAGSDSGSDLGSGAGAAPRSAPASAGNAPQPPAEPATPAVPRVPIVDANPLPGRADRFATPAIPPVPAAPSGASAADLAPPTAPIEPPATVDLRSDGLADPVRHDDDPVRHDDDPPVPAGPVAAGEPGRP
jgi:hypothetical protein